MSEIESLFDGLVAQVQAAGLRAASYTGLSDDELTAAHVAATELMRAAERGASLSAAEIDRRSNRTLGQDGLAWRKGHVNTEAMLQSLTGDGKQATRRRLKVGTMVAEAEAAHDLAVQSAQNPDDDGLARLAAAGQVWHSPLGIAVAGGVIGAETAHSIRQGLGEPAIGVSGEMLAEALVGLIAECAHLNADQAHKEARWARDQIDAAGIAARAESKRERQSLTVWVQTDGMVAGRFLLDPENGMFLKDVVDQLISPRTGGPRFVKEPRKKWYERVLHDPRSTERIAAEGLIELLHVAVNADPGTIYGGARPGVRLIVKETSLEVAGSGTVTGTGTGTRANSDTGHGFIEGHPDVVPIETIERELCATGAAPIMFDDDGQCLNVGRLLRLFNQRQRQGLAARDGGCMWPDCDRPPSWTEAHHIEEWKRDRGRTDIGLGILLCKRHHLLLHNKKWKITRVGNAEYQLIPPVTEDPAQRPIPLHSKSRLHLGSPVSSGRLKSAASAASTASAASAKSRQSAKSASSGSSGPPSLFGPSGEARHTSFLRARTNPIPAFSVAGPGATLEGALLGEAADR